MIKSYKRKRLFNISLIVLAAICVFSYLILRIALLGSAEYSLVDRVVAGLLVAAEVFVLLQCLGYLNNLLQVTIHSKALRTIVPSAEQLDFFPPVAVVVASYREPLEVISDTLTCFYNLTYPNKHLYLLDDTRYDQGKTEEDTAALQQYRAEVEKLCRELKINLFRRSWRGAKAGIINDFLDFINSAPKEGSQLQRFGSTPLGEREKYITIFDADMNPVPDFIEPLVKVLDDNQDFAFVQTPQYYTNFAFNRVARASGLQQAVFYEYICESKAICEAMFCCGTNVMFRIDALREVNGFDELSVTEDFATALALRFKGWKSAYVNRVGAFGMGPEDLSSFFKQQFRWALGTSGLLRRLVPAFMKNPLSLRPIVWWEYFLSGTYYFVGWAFILMILAPVVYLFFGVPSHLPAPHLYFMFYAPYVVLSFSAFFLSLTQRGYRLRDFFFALLLIVISAPIYAKASLLGVLGVKGKFAVTPKVGSNALPLWSLWPQLLLALLSFAAVIWGLNQLIFEQTHVVPFLLNILWSLYFALILSSVLYFNFAQEKL